MLFVAIAPCKAQLQAPPPKLEWRVNLLGLPLLNPNVGLRINTGHAWRPDFTLAYQAPILRFVEVGDNYALIGAFPSLLGHGLTFYGGVTRVKEGRNGESTRFSIQMGAKVFRTGDYYWGIAGQTGTECSVRDHVRATFGPKAMISKFWPLSSYFGLEPYFGLGVRAGFLMEKYSEQGTDVGAGGCLPTDGFVPDQSFRTPELSLVPTVHLGITANFW